MAWAYRFVQHHFPINERALRHRTCNGTYILFFQPASIARNSSCQVCAEGLKEAGGYVQLARKQKNNTPRPRRKHLRNVTPLAATTRNINLRSTSADCYASRLSKHKHHPIATFRFISLRPAGNRYLLTRAKTQELYPATTNQRAAISLLTPRCSVLHSLGLASRNTAVLTPPAVHPACEDVRLEEKFLSRCSTL